MFAALHDSPLTVLPRFLKSKLPLLPYSAIQIPNKPLSKAALTGTLPADRDPLLGPGHAWGKLLLLPNTTPTKDSRHLLSMDYHLCPTVTMPYGAACQGIQLRGCCFSKDARKFTYKSRISHPELF